jgi:RNA polymerase sigma-70 factor, ECF subfamily
VNEQRLIERVLSGDPAAERELYDSHVDRVYRLAFRLAGSAELAEEFTQDAFIRAFDRLSGFRGESALATWLHAITVSVTLNGLRKIKRLRGRHVELDAADNVGTPAHEPMVHLRERLHAAIDGLAEPYRVVFVMHDVEGYTHEEIAGALSVAEGTSKARLSRARARLRAELSELMEEEVS